MEKSYFWTSSEGTDQESPLTGDDFNRVNRIRTSLFSGQGVSMLNKYEISDHGTFFSVGAGYSCVDGQLHYNDSDVNFNFYNVSDVGKKQYNLIGIYCDYNTGKARLKMYEGTPAVNPVDPSYDVISGVSYFMPLYRITITYNAHWVGDLRVFSSIKLNNFYGSSFPVELIPDGSLSADKFEDSSIRADQIADNSLTVSKIPACVMASPVHMGGSASDLSTPGTNTYQHTVGASHSQVSEAFGTIAILAVTNGQTYTVTFPVTLPTIPLVICDVDLDYVYRTVSNVTTSSFTVTFNFSGSITPDIVLSYLYAWLS